MSETIVSCTGATHPVNGKIIHVLGYQNKAKSDGPNRMILPFPAAAVMGRDNTLDTRSMSSVLKDYRRAAAHFFTRRSDSRGMSRGMDSDVDVFDSGSYTVVLVNKGGFNEIQSALETVPKNKRPWISRELYDFLATRYPAWPLALCCWDGAIEPEPLLWWYEPRNTGELFFPGMDAHDGGPPKQGRVMRDHVLAHNHGAGLQPVRFSDPMDETLRPFLAGSVRGFRIDGIRDNGDWYLNLQTGQLECRF
jgi:hypothetical protein